MTSPPDASTRHSWRRRWARVALSGLAGAVTVMLLNEGVRRLVPHVPRMDVIGERGLSKTVRAVDITPPRGEAPYLTTMAGDLLGDTLYYALVGVGSPGGSLARGAALGLAAGVGGAYLPPGLGRQPGETAQTRVLTVAWYTLAGLAAGAVYRGFGRPTNHESTSCKSQLIGWADGEPRVRN